MPEAPMGLASFPGISQVLGGSFTFTQGITPSVCMLEILPQPDDIELDGDLTLTFDDVELTFTDCRIDRASFDYTPAGMIWRLSILDRRVWWRYCDPISGTYNEHFATVQNPAGGVQTGSIDPDSERTPQELATLCLEAMGEEGFDVSELPNNARPEVRWDRDNPAQALADLCDSLGCRVVLTLDDEVAVVRQGSGEDLPTEGVMRRSDVVDPPDPPDSVMVVGGKSRYQVDFLLEAVGLDTDGVIRPIDQLSYTPEAGWVTVLPDPAIGFLEVTGFEKYEVADPGLPQNLYNQTILTYVNPRELARQSVYRWYRIKMSGSADDTTDSPQIPGWGTGDDGWGERLEHLWQILPIEDTQVLGYWDPIDNTFRSFPAWAYGEFYDDTPVTWTKPASQIDTLPGSFLYKDFAIDRERGILKSTEPLYLINDDNTYSPARLYLRCAVTPADHDTRAPERYERERDVTDLFDGAHDTGPRVIRKEEIVRSSIPQYDADYKVQFLLTNEALCDEEADHAISASLFEYQTKQPQDVTYMGFVAVECDGAITQVTWSWGAGGATTRVSRNTEWHAAIPSYRERLQIVRLQRDEPQVRDLIAQARKGGR